MENREQNKLLNISLHYTGSIAEDLVVEITQGSNFYADCARNLSFLNTWTNLLFVLLRLLVLLVALGAAVHLVY